MAALSIARAAAARPKLLLLDEITANLDAETEKEVLEALKRVSENRTVISISQSIRKMGRIIPIEQETIGIKADFYNRRKYVILKYNIRKAHVTGRREEACTVRAKQCG